MIRNWWRSFLNGVATLNVWGTPVKRSPQPPVADVLAKDAAKVHADFMSAWWRVQGTPRSSELVAEIFQHPGEYVAVADGHVVAHAPTGLELVAQLRAIPELRPRAVIQWVPRPDDPIDYGSGGVW